MNGQVKILDQSIIRSRVRVLDFFELMKPELTFLSVLTTLCGFYLASTGSFNFWLFLHTAIGTALVGGGAGALNQYIERIYDGLMKRTERRPLPAGRLTPIGALIFGITISLIGIVQLTIFTNPLTGFLATLTLTTYLFLYTPLKRITPIATLIGGIPGALPPMMGWTAVRNEITIEAWILFGILFCWHMPHFLSLAWMYRKDYARAGFKILTVTDQSGERTTRQILIYCIALIPLSIAPAMISMTGLFGALGGFLLGLAFISIAVVLVRSSGQTTPEALAKINFHARRMFVASLIYLPALITMMSFDKI